MLRLIVDLDGEQVKRVKPVIGYLHTGIEKQMEALRWQQGVVSPTGTTTCRRRSTTSPTRWRSRS